MTDEVARVCPWWFCRARLNEWCTTPRGRQRENHLLRSLWVRSLRWWKTVTYRQCDHWLLNERCVLPRGHKDPFLHETADGLYRWYW